MIDEMWNIIRVFFVGESVLGSALCALSGDQLQSFRETPQVTHWTNTQSGLSGSLI